VPLRVVSHDATPDLTDQVLRADQAVKAELFTADRRLMIAALLEKSGACHPKFRNFGG